MIIEFPDMEPLNAWYNSPEYQPLIALRKEAIPAPAEQTYASEAVGEEPLPVLPCM